MDEDWKGSLVKRHYYAVTNTSTFVPYEVKIQSRNSHGWGPEPKVVTGYSGEDGELKSYCYFYNMDSSP